MLFSGRRPLLLILGCVALSLCFPCDLGAKEQSKTGKAKPQKAQNPVPEEDDLTKDYVDLLGVSRENIGKELSKKSPSPPWSLKVWKNYAVATQQGLPDAFLQIELLFENNKSTLVKATMAFMQSNSVAKGKWHDIHGVASKQPQVKEPKEKPETSSAQGEPPPPPPPPLDE